MTYSTDASSPSGTAFSFSGAGNASKTLFTGNYVEIDTTKTYELSVYAKDTAGTNTYYMGIDQLDIDKNRIGAANIYWAEGSTTRLARDIKNGDTTIYLEDVSGFVNASQYYQLGFIFWNYKDSTGYQYPKETYSRNVVKGTSGNNLFDYADINFTNNTITLNYAWNGVTYTAGTELSQCSSGSAYMYCLLSNKPMTTSWEQYSATISGYQTNNLTPTKFRQGTKYVRLLIIRNTNSSNTSNVTSSFTNISIKKV